MKQRLSSLLVLALCMMTLSACVDNSSPEAVLNSSFKALSKNSTKKNVELAQEYFLGAALVQFGSEAGMLSLQNAVVPYKKLRLGNINIESTIILEVGERALRSYSVEVLGVTSLSEKSRVLTAGVQCDYTFERSQCSYEFDEGCSSRPQGWYDSNCAITDLNF